VEVANGSGGFGRMRIGRPLRGGGGVDLPARRPCVVEARWDWEQDDEGAG
jgi:hypothetical protein